MGVTAQLSACFCPVPCPGCAEAVLSQRAGAVLPKHAVPRPGWERAAFVRTGPILMSTPSPLQLLSVCQGAQAQGSSSPPLLLGSIPTLTPWAGNPLKDSFGEHAAVSLQGCPCLLPQFQADIPPESCWHRPGDGRSPGFPLVWWVSQTRPFVKGCWRLCSSLPAPAGNGTQRKWQQCSCC